MAVNPFNFIKLLTDVLAFPKPWNRATLQQLHNETRDYINDELKPAIDALQAPPKARVYNNANQSIGNGVTVALAFNSERYDTDNIHDTVTNNTRLTCKTAGEYLISGNVSFDANATGIRFLAIRLDGGTYIGRIELPSSGASNPTELNISTHYNLAANDYVELVVIQTSGGNLNVVSGDNYSPEFSMIRIGS